MRSIFVFAAALALTGCTTTQERYTANNQLTVEPLIYDQMILDNLVDIMLNPATLPYFATLDSGIPQVADSVGLSGIISFAPQSLVKQLHNQRGGQIGPISGSRSIQTNWTLKPVNDDNRLRAMRYVYLWVTGHPDPDGAKAEKTMTAYYPLKDDCSPTFFFNDLRKCWIRSGHIKDSKAHYYTRRHLTVYWVDPEYEKDFVELGLIIRRIALHAPRTTVVHTYDYRTDGKLAQQTVITGALAPDCKKLKEKQLAALKAAIPLIAKQAANEYVTNLPKTDEDKRENATESMLSSRQRDLLRTGLPDIIERHFAEGLNEPGRINSLEQLDKSFESLLTAKSISLSVVRAVDRAVASNAIDPAKKQGVLELLDKHIQPPFQPEAIPVALRSQIAERYNAAKPIISQEVASQSALPPDPELTIDTFSNPEISPGLVTLPH